MFFLQQMEETNVLMGVISGKCVDVVRKYTDQQIVDIALDILQGIFPEQVQISCHIVLYLIEICVL